MYGLYPVQLRADYVSGGLNGGTSAAFLAMCKELDRRTEQDIRNGVVPLWHDESQLNRYAAEHPGSYRLLTPPLTGTRKAGRCPLS